MDGLVCDACGGTLLLEAEVRYVVKIDGYAAYDPLELTRRDLERDFDAEMKALMETLSSLGEDEAQDQVHRAFVFDLCPACWRRYIKDPLSGLRTAGEKKTGPPE